MPALPEGCGKSRFEMCCPELRRGVGESPGSSRGDKPLTQPPNRRVRGLTLTRIKSRLRKRRRAGRPGSTDGVAAAWPVLDRPQQIAASAQLAVERRMQVFLWGLGCSRRRCSSGLGRAVVRHERLEHWLRRSGRDRRSLGCSRLERFCQLLGRRERALLRQPDRRQTTWYSLSLLCVTTDLLPGERGAIVNRPTLKWSGAEYPHIVRRTLLMHKPRLPHGRSVSR